jgi:hypothetical protein
LEAQVGVVLFGEMIRFFALGTAIFVDPQLDLVAVGVAVSLDDKVTVDGWMNTVLVAKVSDDQAREWLDGGASVTACVVKPFVLVQPLG